MSVKSSVLALLEAQKGIFVSGEELASRFSCSRAAVWKAIQALRQEGYPIQAAPNRGYALDTASNLLSPEAVSRYLDKKAGPVFVYKEVPSTNQLLKQKALTEGTALPAGAMVLAESQTAGRGHGGRSFFSPVGTGLYLSLLFRPACTIRQNLAISAAAAVAAAQAVEAVCGVPLDMKWVNDLYFRGKKVGGILTEAVSSLETGVLEFAIVGFGLNLMEPLGGFPDSLKDSAGAITPDGRAADGSIIDRNRLAAEIANRFLRKKDFETVPEVYRTRNLVTGQSALLQRPDGSRIPVQAGEILPDGRLTVIYGDGREELLTCGEIHL